MSLALAHPQLQAIADACRRHHMARMDVFGSVLRPDYRPGESDIDLLVEFQPLDPASLYKAYFALLNDLLRGLAAHVDLVMAVACTIPTSNKVLRSVSNRSMQRDPRVYLSDILGFGSLSLADQALHPLQQRFIAEAVVESLHQQGEESGRAAAKNS